MSRHRNQGVEDWADEMLERHRSAPAGSASIEDDLFADRIRRYGEMQRRFADLEAIASLVGVVLLCAFAFAFYSGF